jgi:hypothetical protein
MCRSILMILVLLFTGCKTANDGQRYDKQEYLAQRQKIIAKVTPAPYPSECELTDFSRMLRNWDSTGILDSVWTAYFAPDGNVSPILTLEMGASPWWYYQLFTVLSTDTGGLIAVVTSYGVADPPKILRKRISDAKLRSIRNQLARSLEDIPEDELLGAVADDGNQDIVVTNAPGRLRGFIGCNLQIALNKDPRLRPFDELLASLLR